MIIKFEMDKEMYKAMKRYEKAREENNEEEMKKAKEDMKMYNEFRNNEKKTNIIQNTILPVLKIGVDVAGVVLPLLFYSKWVSEGLKFEQEGTFTSQTLKSLMAKMKPTGK